MAKKKTQSIQKENSTIVPENLGVKGFKVFDENWQCQKFQYEVGKTYEMLESEIEMCERGFHFCKRCVDCFRYKEFNPKNKVAEIIALGKVLDTDDKSVTNKIQILREISWDEMLRICNVGKENSGHSNSGNSNSGHSNSGHSNSGNSNSGNSNSGHSNSGHSNSGNYNSGDSNSRHSNSGNYNSGHSNSGYSNSGDSNSGHSNSGNYNSGHSNSGNHNSGDSNSGHSNSGDSNSGHSNSGNYNSGHYNSGHFNTITPAEILVFNRLCKCEDWNNAKLPDFFFDVNLNQFIWKSNMTDLEKSENPNYSTLDGYLKKVSYKDAWKIAWQKATLEDKKLLKKLPNFDIKIFEEITGIVITPEELNSW